MLVSQLRGRVIPAVPVPFDARGRIDLAAQHRYVDWMRDQPAGGVAVWAHTGRGLKLDDAGRAAVLEAWRSGAPALPVICGIGVPDAEALPSGAAARAERVIARTVQMAEAARTGGAAGVLVYPPAAFARLPDADRRVVDLHAAVAAVGLPVMAFHLYPAASGLAYGPDLVRDILALDGVIGIKIATLNGVMEYQDLVPVVRARGALLVTGEDRFLGYSLLMGADAALIGLGAACTAHTAGLLDAWFQRRPDEFLARSVRVDAFARATFTAPMDGYVQRMLWALEADGVLVGDPRDPFAPDLPPDARARVRDAVRALHDR